MLTNFHTHTNLCDGQNTPEQVVQAAIEKGFSALGFSCHGYTSFDLRYCVNDTEAYIAEILRLKEAYQDKIRIYLGVEEEALSPIDRSRYEYMIGSLHYLPFGGEYLPIDGNPDYFAQCLAACDGDEMRLAEGYYSMFCDYILRRKPDIIGHFDLVTKFDEIGVSHYFANEQYTKLAQKYLQEAIKADCIFEVNTGAMARGYRTAPYPHEDLLHTLKKADAKLILSSDSHAAETLDFGMEEAKKLLREVGFRKLYTLCDEGFVPYDI